MSAGALRGAGLRGGEEPVVHPHGEELAGFRCGCLHEREVVGAEPDVLDMGASFPGGGRSSCARRHVRHDIRLRKSLTLRLRKYSVPDMTTTQQDHKASGMIRVIEQTHEWGDCRKVDGWHCHCALQVAAIKAGESRTCRHCGERAS